MANFASCVWKHVEDTQGSRGQFKQILACFKHNLVKFGVPQITEANSHLYPELFGVTSYVNNSTWWAHAKDNEKKPGRISVEDNIKIMNWTPDSLIGLRHKFAHVVLYYSGSRADDLKKVEGSDWVHYPTGCENLEYYDPFIIFYPDQMKNNPKNDFKNGKIITCCCEESSHSISCPLGVCLEYLNAIPDSRRSSLGIVRQVHPSPKVLLGKII